MIMENGGLADEVVALTGGPSVSGDLRKALKNSSAIYTEFGKPVINASDLIMLLATDNQIETVNPKNVKEYTQKFCDRKFEPKK